MKKIVNDVTCQLGTVLRILYPVYSLNLIEGLRVLGWTQLNMDGCEACLLFDSTRHFESVSFERKVRRL
jgi:hypothetical protein